MKKLIEIRPGEKIPAGAKFVSSRIEKVRTGSREVESEGLFITTTYTHGVFKEQTVCAYEVDTELESR